MRQNTHWKWRLDEVYVRINGVMRYRSRAADAEGKVLKSFITKEQNKVAVLKFIKKALKRHGSPRAVTNDGLRLRRGNARARMRGEAGGGRWANNRVENSHLPFRRRERAMTRFRRMHTLQKFSAVQASFHNHFGVERHLTSREQMEDLRSADLAGWRALAA